MSAASTMMPSAIRNGLYQRQVEPRVWITVMALRNAKMRNRKDRRMSVSARCPFALKGLRSYSSGPECGNFGHRAHAGHRGGIPVFRCPAQELRYIGVLQRGIGCLLQILQGTQQYLRGPFDVRS